MKTRSTDSMGDNTNKNKSSLVYASSPFMTAHPVGNQHFQPVYTRSVSRASADMYTLYPGYPMSPQFVAQLELV